MQAIPQYTGWRLNCYAAALSMLLTRGGEPKPIHYIDCLTTIPFGPFVYWRKRGFAVMGGLNPEDGLDFAISLLGYEYSISFTESQKDALAKLKENLKNDWVLIGPVDMSYLTYDPFCKKKKGADHYIVGVDCDNNFIWINDPEGYIEVPLPWQDFLEAWYAKRIYYKKGPYTQRILKEKIKEPSDEEIFKSVLLKATETAKGEHIPSGAIYGEKAIRNFANDLKNKGKISMLLLTFILPVCNQRCYDSAVFLGQENLTNEVLSEASKLRMLQAKLFGECRLFANLKNMDAIHLTLNRIADIDVSYTKMFIKGTEML